MGKYVSRMLYIAFYVLTLPISWAQADDLRQTQPSERAMLLSTDESYRENSYRRTYYLRWKNGEFRIGFLSANCHKGKEDVYIYFHYYRQAESKYGSRTTNKSCSEFLDQFEKEKDWAQYFYFDDKAPLSELIFEESQFDIEDRNWMAHINEVFHGNKSIVNHTTRSLHHGKKTKEVYILLPGIAVWNTYMDELSSKLFFQGSNVIFGALPGQEIRNQKGAFISELAHPAVWLQYAETLSRLAKSYGEKVIFVGQSTGGNLAVRMAEQGLVDGIILLQPLIGTTAVHKSGAYAIDGLLNSKSKLVHGFSYMATHALALEKLPYKKLNSTIKIRIYIADYDPVVYSPSTVEWVKNFAPQAEVVKSTKSFFNGHMDRNLESINVPFFQEQK